MDGIHYSKLFTHKPNFAFFNFQTFNFSAIDGEGSEAVARKHAAQLKALETDRSAEKSIRNRIKVIIKALQQGWDYAHKYEKILNGVSDDPIDEKVRKALDSKKRKKDAMQDKTSKQGAERSTPYKLKYSPYSTTAGAYQMQAPAWNNPPIQPQHQPTQNWGPAYPWYGGYQAENQTAASRSPVPAILPPPPPPPSSAPARKDPFYCFKCGQEGHTAKACPENKQK